jgi:glycosyltransferase involved in cell wall biosynthesis
LPEAPYFLSVGRFAPEKNLVRLIESFARYRREAGERQPWDLVLCGDGPTWAEVEEAVASSSFAHAIHRPGFLQAGALSCWYAHAGAFILPSLMEPWGLVVNEAAASGLPLLVSRRAGCAATLVPDVEETTGARFDPLDVDEIADKLSWIATRPTEALEAMGRSAAATVSRWGPERFAQGVIEAIGLARPHRPHHKKATLLTTGTR